MVITNFVDYYSEEVGRFEELVIRLRSNGFAMDDMGLTAENSGKSIDELQPEEGH